jgi:hypothetical protein
VLDFVDLTEPFFGVFGLKFIFEELFEDFFDFSFPFKDCSKICLFSFFSSSSS